MLNINKQMPIVPAVVMLDGLKSVSTDDEILYREEAPPHSGSLPPNTLHGTDCTTCTWLSFLWKCICIP